MKNFLSQVAEILYNNYGDGVSSLNIVFPSRRARLFFSDELSAVAKKPLWQPRYLSVGDIMEKLAGIRAGDGVKLVTELYRVYRRYHEEDFDSFYFWGETLLADFDTIDKYMADAGALFRNVSELKDMEKDLSYLDPQQRDMIRRFWGSFGDPKEYSGEKKDFVRIWETLYPIYREFRESLGRSGLAYEGMVYRMAAEKVRESGAEELAGEKYVIVGFNALSKCEETVFDYLRRQCGALFFWDYDLYYTEDLEQEAGASMRGNILRYPEQFELPCGRDNFSREKRITAVSAPSDSMQCRYAGKFLSDILAQHGKAGRETAVVLTDDNLLTPLLYSIPEGVEDINVTMGYPFKDTLLYSFIERLIQLQIRERRVGGKVFFYHTDVTGLLRHPFLLEKTGGDSSELAGRIVSQQHIYVDAEQLRGDDFTACVFSDTGGDREKFSAYLCDIIRSVSAPSHDDGKRDVAESKRRREFCSIADEYVNKLHNSLIGCDIDISLHVYASLLRRVLQKVRIPFEGEPLTGVQVMGILETRSLDFENLIILSLNDDNFPGSAVSSRSFIPHNLRIAYGLPAVQDSEAVYAYYLYRLIQRASNIHLVYSSGNDDGSNSEQSRFLYQFRYESPHRIRNLNIGLNIDTDADNAVAVEKKGTVRDKLGRYLHGGVSHEQPAGAGRKPVLTPTSIYNYVQCPLKFYFYSIEKIRPPEEVSGEMDASVFGNTLHRAMEILYRPLAGREGDCRHLFAQITETEVENAVDQAIDEIYPREGGEEAGENLSGNVVLARDIIIRYILDCVVPFDISGGGRRIAELEKSMEYPFEFMDTAGNLQKVSIGGYADRIDELDNGRLRVIDYKTGKANREFKSIEALFSEEQADRNPAVLQSFIYAMIIAGTTGKDVQPALYFVREMNREGYSPLLADKSAKGTAVDSYSVYAGEFEGRLSVLLAEIFDTDIPFTQCADDKVCAVCDFREICRR